MKTNRYLLLLVAIVILSLVCYYLYTRNEYYQTFAHITDGVKQYVTYTNPGDAECGKSYLYTTFSNDAMQACRAKYGDEYDITDAGCDSSKNVQGGSCEQACGCCTSYYCNGTINPLKVNRKKCKEHCAIKDSGLIELCAQSGGDLTKCASTEQQQANVVNCNRNCHSTDSRETCLKNNGDFSHC